MEVPRDKIDWHWLNQVDDATSAQWERRNAREQTQFKRMLLYGDPSPAAPSPGNRAAVNIMKAQQLLSMSAQYVDQSLAVLEEEEAVLDQQIQDLESGKEQVHSDAFQDADEQEEYHYTKNILRARAEEIENLHAFVERTKPELAARLFVDKHGQVKVRTTKDGGFSRQPSVATVLARENAEGTWDSKRQGQADTVVAADEEES